jgi:hypothetical protein
MFKHSRHTARNPFDFTWVQVIVSGTPNVHKNRYCSTGTMQQVQLFFTMITTMRLPDTGTGNGGRTGTLTGDLYCM